MAGDINNASFWADADVYIGPLDAPNPTDATTEFGVEWDLVGLLDGNAGFTFSREEEKTDHYAWGGIIVRTRRRNFKQTITFTALEDNETTRDLIWPDSPPGELLVPRPKQVKLALEMREGDKVRRLITAENAEVEVNGDINENEADLTRYSLIATIYPDASVSPARLFYEQTTEAGSS